MGFELLTLPGERAVPLDARASQWLSVGEKTGIQVLSRDGTVQSSWPRTAEFLDHRVISNAQSSRRVFASFDTSRGALLLYSINQDAGELVQEFVSEPVDYPVEGLCLFLDPASRLHVFLLNEAFTAHQYLLLPDAASTWQMVNLRTLPIGPGSEHCAVQDETQTLYVSENGVSVWAHSANPEAELEREIIELAAPWGNLGDGPLGLAATATSLLVLSEDGPTLHELSTQTDSASAMSRQQLPLTSSESISAIEIDGNKHVTAYDESEMKFAHVLLPVTRGQIIANSLPLISPSAETAVMPQGGDAADDPAIWINPQDATQSLVLGTNKRQGLFVYGLDGRQRQQLSVGRVNNVDVRYGARWHGDVVDLAAASNRDTQSVSLFAINRRSGELSHVTDMPTPLTGIYGLCLYQDPGGQIHVYANDEDGTYLHYTLETSDEAWTGTLVREFKVASQPEGCVASDRTGQLYIGEEDVGIWTLGAGTTDSTTLSPVAMVGNELHDDVEGLALYAGAEHEYLLASSQGNDSYVLFEAEAPYTPLGAFQIGMDLQTRPMIDGVSETDGLEVLSSNLGGPYSEGILVVQDGRNVLPAEAQNFKLIPWSAVRAVIPH